MTPVSVIVLTMGGRKTELAQLDESLGNFDGERILVLNGPDAEPLAGWTLVRPESNLGVPGGRNAGAGVATGDVLIFIDDDAKSRTPHLITSCLHHFVANPKLGAVGFRIVVKDTTRTLRRWNPRLAGRKPDQGGPVTSFPGGGHAIRRDAFLAAGGYCDEFFYALEETDLAWRILDAGWDVTYAPDLMIEHPETALTRHTSAMVRTARNRMWLARRSLPWPLAAAYVSTWFAYTALRTRNPSEVKELITGTREGLAPLPAPRKPIRWSTAWKMARSGRPPVF